MTHAQTSFPDIATLAEHCASQFADVVQRAVSMTHAAGAAIALVDGEEVLTAASAGSSVPPPGTRSRISGFTGLAIQKRETLVCDDTQTDTRVDASVCGALDIRSMAVTPVKVRGVVEGALAVFFNAPRAITRTHVAMIRTLADVAAALLEREGPHHREPVPLVSPKPAPAAPIEIQTAPAPVPMQEATKPGPAASAADVLKDITDDEIAETLAQLHAVQESVPPKNPPIKPSVAEPKAGLKTSALIEPVAQVKVAPKPKPDKAEVLPAAVDPIGDAAVHAIVPTQPEPQTHVYSEPHPAASSDVPLFHATVPEQRSPWMKRAVPIAGIAAIVIAVAGFVYRGAGGKATVAAATPQAASEAVTPPAPVTVASTDTTPPTPPQPAPEARTKPMPVQTAVSEPAPERRAAPMVLPPSTSAMQREESVEAPALSGAVTSASVALPAPKVGVPAAPRPAIFVAAKVARQTPPVYPQMALTRRIEGQVMVRARVSKDGTVAQVQALTGHSLLREAAAHAVKSWRYAPATQDGTPVDSEVQVSVNFRLPGGM